MFACSLDCPCAVNWWNAVPRATSFPFLPRKPFWWREMISGCLWQTSTRSPFDLPFTGMGMAGLKSVLTGFMRLEISPQPIEKPRCRLILRRARFVPLLVLSGRYFLNEHGGFIYKGSWNYFLSVFLLEYGTAESGNIGRLVQIPTRGTKESQLLKTPKQLKQLSLPIFFLKLKFPGPQRKTQVCISAKHRIFREESQNIIWREG